MEFMPGPRTTEDYFVDGPPNFNQNTEPPIDYSAKRNPYSKKYADEKPADYFNEQLSAGEMTKGQIAGTRGGQFLSPYNAVPSGAPANVRNLMNGLQGQTMRFDSRNVDNGVGFNNDSDYLEIGPGRVSFGGSDVDVSVAPDGISGRGRLGDKINVEGSFNPGWNGAPERASAGINFNDGRFNAGVSGSIAEGQNPTVKGNIGYNGENGGISAEAGIDAQGKPDVGVNFNVGQPQLQPEEIEAKKSMVPGQITDALNPNPNVSPQLPPQMTGEPLSPGRQFAMGYINDNFGDRLRKGGSSLLY